MIKLTESTGHVLLVKPEEISAVSVDVKQSMVIGEEPTVTSIIYIGAQLRFRVNDTPEEIFAQQPAGSIETVTRG